MWDIWGRGGICTGFLRVNLQDGDHLEELSSQEENIKMGVIEMGWGSWTIHVAQDMAKCGAVLHTVMNLQVL